MASDRSSAKEEENLKAENDDNDISDENNVKENITHIDSYKEQSSLALNYYYMTLTIFCVSIHLIPCILLLSESSNNEVPVLDEMYLIDTRGGSDPNVINNDDIMGKSSFGILFTNDYWGRNMWESNSHKSWRPLTVLSFRYLNSLTGLLRGLEKITGLSTVSVHRLINILLHSLLADATAIAGLTLFPPASSHHYHRSTLQFTITKLIFALHPTHVEAVVNAANRGHLLALLASLYCIFHNTNYVVISTALFCVIGLLSSETMVFQLPGILMTAFVLLYKREQKKRNNNNISVKETKLSFITSILRINFHQFYIPTVTIFLYLAIRYMYDTLTIPNNLISQAESPFAHLTGFDRVLNYSYVVAVHVFKAFFLDPIGFSHEYGFNCVPVISTVWDNRLSLPLFVAACLMLCGEQAVSNYHNNNKNEEAILQLLFALSWSVSLFPVSGIMTVGTFIADRMVIPFSFAVCVLGGKFLSDWILLLSSPKPNNKTSKTAMVKVALKAIVVALCLSFVSMRVCQRSGQWMSSIELFESSLEACPRYAKANLQLSKIHSGTISRHMDLDKSLVYASTAEDIDPDFCRVHYQFAVIYHMQQNHLDFEERLTKALLCAHTASKAINLWGQYWKIMIDADPSAAARMQSYERFLQEQYKLRQTDDDGATGLNMNNAVTGRQEL